MWNALIWRKLYPSIINIEICVHYQTRSINEFLCGHTVCFCLFSIKPQQIHVILKVFQFHTVSSFEYVSFLYFVSISWYFTVCWCFRSLCWWSKCIMAAISNGSQFRYFTVQRYLNYIKNIDFPHTQFYICRIVWQFEKILWNS